MTSLPPDITYADIIKGTKKNDTFEINNNRIPVLIQNSKGTDTIYFKNINNINDLYFFQQPGTKNLSIYADGEGLLVTIENYFKSIAGTSTKSSIKNIKIGDDVYSIINDGLFDYDGVFKIKKNKITGTVFNDTIDLTDTGKYNPKKGVTVKSGKGNDTITGSAFNDKITGGAGANTFIYKAGGGEDKVYLTKDEDLTIYYDMDGSAFNESEFKLTKDGKSWVLSRTYTKDGLETTDKITLVNLNKTNKTKDIQIIIRDENGEELIYDLPNGLIKDNNGDILKRIEGTDFNEGNVIKGTLTATNLGDNIYLLDYEGKPNTTNHNIKYGATIKAGTGNDTIKGSDYGDYIIAGNGNNDITAGKGYDLISLGTGANKLHYTYTDFTETNKNIETENNAIKEEHKKDWYKYTKPYKENIDCIMGATSDDTLYLNGIDQDSITFLKDGNNLEICFTVKETIGDHENESIDSYSAVAFLNYFKSKDKFDNIIFSDNEEFSIADYLKTEYTLGGNNYLLQTGKGKIKAVEGCNNGIVGSSKADTITGGNDESLADFIIGGAGNDKITGKAGTTYLQYMQGDGSDTVYLTKNEKITLLYVIKGDNYNSDEFDVKKSSDGKDLIVSRTYTNEKNKVVTDKITFKNAANIDVDGIVLKIFTSEIYQIDGKDAYDFDVAGESIAEIDLLKEIFDRDSKFLSSYYNVDDVNNINEELSSFTTSSDDGLSTDTYFEQDENILNSIVPTSSAQDNSLLNN